MPIHLKRDLDELKKEILTMGSMVEEAIDKVITALQDRRQDLIGEILADDDLIDQKELDVEDECLKILALHQPVASDLRFIVAIMKVNNDLERMGDLAVNIAERAAALMAAASRSCEVDFKPMQDQVRGMVRDSLDALVNHDPISARAIVKRDDAVDDANREIFRACLEAMRRDTHLAESAIHTLLIARHLERIADLATNIAEDVVFMVEGDVIRHLHE